MAMDFGTGLGAYAQLMQQGYKDRLDLQKYAQEYDYRAQQDQIKNAVAQQQANYLYPSRLKMPTSAAALLTKDPQQVVSDSLMQGALLRPDPIVNVRQQWDPVNRRYVNLPGDGPNLQSVGGRNPQSLDPQAAQAAEGMGPPSQGEAPAHPADLTGNSYPHILTEPEDRQLKKTVAQQLGLQDNGDTVEGDGAQMARYYDTLDKLVGVIGQGFGYGMRPQQVINQPAPDRPPPQGRGGSAKAPGLGDYEKQQIKDLEEQKKEYRDALKDPFAAYQAYRGQATVTDPNTGAVRKARSNEISGWLMQQQKAVDGQIKQIYDNSRVGATSTGGRKPKSTSGVESPGGVPSGAVKKAWDTNKNQTVYLDGSGQEVGRVNGLQ